MGNLSSHDPLQGLSIFSRSAREIISLGLEASARFEAIEQAIMRRLAMPEPTPPMGGGPQDFFLGIIREVDTVSADPEVQYRYTVELLNGTIIEAEPDYEKQFDTLLVIPAEVGDEVMCWREFPEDKKGGIAGEIGGGLGDGPGNEGPIPPPGGPGTDPPPTPGEPQWRLRVWKERPQIINCPGTGEPLQGQAQNAGTPGAPQSRSTAAKARPPVPLSVMHAEGYSTRQVFDWLIAKAAGLATTYQPLDSDLTAIAALTTTAFGRALLELANAGALASAAGLGTGDSPQFTAVNVGHASDTTITRTGAGDLAVEGNALYRAGGTDVPVADGGTGASTAAGARTNLDAAQNEGWTVIIKAADQDVTNAGVTDDSHFTFSVTAGNKYLVIVDLVQSGNNTTGDWTCDFAVAAGTMTGFGTMLGHGAAGTVQHVAVAAVVAANTTAVNGYGVGDLTFGVNQRIQYTFIPSNTTTFKFRFGNTAAAAGRTSRTWKGSVLRHKDIT